MLQLQQPATGAGGCAAGGEGRAAEEPGDERWRSLRKRSSSRRPDQARSVGLGVRVPGTAGRDRGCACADARGRSCRARAGRGAGELHATLYI